MTAIVHLGTGIELDLAAEIEALLGDLDRLGSVAAIAEFLKESDCGGEQCNSECCILANYLRAEACCDYVSVNDNQLECRRGEEEYRGPIPTTVSQFIRAFDDGEFPHLASNWVEFDSSDPPY